MKHNILVILGIIGCALVLKLSVILASHHILRPSVITSSSEGRRNIKEGGAKDIYYNLRMNSGAPEMLPARLTISQAPLTINAYAAPGRIILTSGALNFVKSKDELAEVLGHEMGHIMMMHSSMRANIKNIDQRLLEANADKFGLYLMLKSGYNICKARDFFVRLNKQNGDSVLTTDHPGYTQRIDELTFPQCSY